MTNSLPMPEGLTAYQQSRWDTWSRANQEGIIRNKRWLRAIRRVRYLKRDLKEAEAELEEAQKYNALRRKR